MARPPLPVAVHFRPGKLSLPEARQRIGAVSAALLAIEARLEEKEEGEPALVKQNLDSRKERGEK